MDESGTLEVESLKVRVEEKKILNGISLRLKRGERSFIFGPNGSGKSTLLKTIMGIPSYVVESGSIKYNGSEINNMNVYERSKLGITMAFQQPPEIRGVKLSQILKLCLAKKEDRRIQHRREGCNREVQANRVPRQRRKRRVLRRRTEEG